MSLLRTALYGKHLSLGAKMVEFAGFEMPVRYTSLSEEHHAVRTRCGVFDVSHMGEFIISGKEALSLISYVSSNNPARLSVGQAQYSCLPNDTGGIVDDLLIYRLDESKYMLVVNASNIAKDWEWIFGHNRWSAHMEDISSRISLLAVQGPAAKDLLQPLTDIELDKIPYYHFAKGELAGQKDIIVSATGYTGSGGFELYIPNEGVSAVWDAIFSSSTKDLVVPAGLGARDTLRLEMGYCLYGNDINDETSPLEAGLGWITKFDHDFIHCEKLLKQKEAGVSRKLVGFEMLERGIPRHGYEVLNSDGQEIGFVTSGTQSPSLDKGIGLAYVSVPHHLKDSSLYIQIRKKTLEASVCKLPFYNPPK